jgi:hypothetical protein
MKSRAPEWTVIIIGLLLVIGIVVYFESTMEFAARIDRVVSDQR